MLFSSISFLYYFLPAILAIYFIAPKSLKNAVLLLGSLIFYAWGEPRFAIIMVATALAGYLAGLLLGRLQSRAWRRVTLVAGIAVILLPLVLFKYGDFLIANLNSLVPGTLNPLHLTLPIGVSFYTFQILSYVIDLARGEIGVEKNPFYFLMYVSFFPQLIAGPIVRFQTIQDEIRNRQVTLELFSSGIGRFVTGLGKKVLLANTLAEFHKELAGAPTTVLSLWLVALAFTLQIYFDFSGYSDMAIGLGRMFGFHFLENFEYPYLSTSVTDFWRRWHISLGSWFRDYVYIPLGGNRGSWARRVLNLLIVWLLTGLWHGAAWNFVAWGLFYFLVLSFERAGLGRLLKKIPVALRILYTFVLVLLGFVLFNADSLAVSLAHLGGMFGAGPLPLKDPLTLYYLKSYLLIILVGLFGASPLPRKIVEKMKSAGNGLARDWMPIAGMIFVLLFSTASLIDGSFNPFLYFRF